MSTCHDLAVGGGGAGGGGVVGCLKTGEVWKMVMAAGWASWSSSALMIFRVDVSEQPWNDVNAIDAQNGLWRPVPYPPSVVPTCLTGELNPCIN